uniref:Uncharacterized protein n=1 Tax=Steinernema glaseri TaxID=37863 RepID=A0A1I8ANV3_9BILA
MSYQAPYEMPSQMSYQAPYEMPSQISYQARYPPLPPPVYRMSRTVTVLRSDPVPKRPKKDVEVVAPAPIQTSDDDCLHEASTDFADEPVDDSPVEAMESFNNEECLAALNAL